MGKAYKEEEKKEIQNRLLEAGLEAFHNDSFKAFNIREIAKKAGISQGSFYNFYNNKDEFVIDIIKYRALQKIRIIMKALPTSLDKLSDYLSDVLYKYLIELKYKSDVRKIYIDLFNILLKDSEIKNNNMHSAFKGNVRSIFREFFNEISFMYSENNLKTKIDVDGLVNVMAGAIILIVNSSKMDLQYFEDILKVYIKSNVLCYVKGDNEDD